MKVFVLVECCESGSSTPIVSTDLDTLKEELAERYQSVCENCDEESIYENYVSEDGTFYRVDYAEDMKFDECSISEVEVK